MRAPAITATLCALLATPGCIPDLEDADTLVSEPRVLAVRAEPAELARGQTASLEALYVDASGRIEPVALDWAFCMERKPLAELGPINAACLAAEGDALEPIGVGPVVDGKMPMDACRSFGPDRPPPKADEPAGRPVDPDPTGGYYQPVRLYDVEQEAFALFELRVSCNLPGVAQPTSAQYARRYRRNQNPELAALRVVQRGDDRELVPDDPEQAFTVAPGQRIALQASWDECASGEECGDGLCGPGEDEEACAEDCMRPPAQGCPGAEPYLHYDLAARDFVYRREALRLSWFASAGSFDEPRTGRSDAESEQTMSDNGWTAPDQEGDVRLWLVLRDDRGGASFHEYALRVQR